MDCSLITNPTCCKSWKYKVLWRNFLVGTFNISHLCPRTCAGSPAVASDSGDEQQPGEQQEATRQHHACVPSTAWVCFLLTGLLLDLRRSPSFSRWSEVKVWLPDNWRRPASGQRLIPLIVFFFFFSAVVIQTSVLKKEYRQEHYSKDKLSFSVLVYYSRSSQDSTNTDMKKLLLLLVFSDPHL